MRPRLETFVRFWFLLLCPMLAWSAQTECLTTGLHAAVNVTGTVRDPSGAVIVKAGVELRGSGPEQQTVTDARGRFVFNCVRAGKYRLAVTAPTFRPRTVALTVSESAPHPLDITLEIPPVQVSIEAVKENEPETTEGAGERVLNQKDLQGLADDPDDLLRQLQALAASAGGAPGEATLEVDGFESASRLPPKSAIREVRINPDLFSAEYGKPPYEGGRIEVFTKPGQTDLHGALFFNYNGPALSARDPLAATRPSTNTERYGFELTGPILRNKADFALDLEQRSIHEFSAVRAITLDASGHSQLVQQNIPTPQGLWIGNARFDWQATPKHILVFSYSANVTSTLNQATGGLTLQQSGYNEDSREDDLRLTSTYTISARALNEAHIGWSLKHSRQTPFSTDPALIVVGSFEAGGVASQFLNRREHDIQFDDDVILSHRAHNLKIGVQVDGDIVNEANTANFNGVLTFGGGLAPALLSDGSIDPGRLIYISGLEQYQRMLLHQRGGNPTSFELASGDRLVKLQQWHVAAYAQDQVKVTDKVSLALGLRYSAQTNPAVTGVVAPRLGIAWSPDKDRKWVLRARAGLFYDSIELPAALQVARLDGVHRFQSITYPPAPLSSGSQPLTIKNEWRFSSAITQSPSGQLQLAVEHEFPGHWKPQVDLYLSRGWSSLRSRNVNAPLLGASMTDALLAPRPFAPNLNLFEIQPSGSIKGPVIFAGLEQSSYKRFKLFVGYLYFNMRSNADFFSTFAQSSFTDAGEWARPDWQAAHRLFVVTTVNLPLGITWNSFFDASSGTPFNIVAGTDNNGDGVFNDRPSIVTVPTPSSVPTIYGLLDPNVALGNLPRNRGTLPAIFALDGSLSRSFSLGTHDSSRSILVTLRSSNLLNHSNVRAVDAVVGSPFFGHPVSTEQGRRLELGLRYNF